MICLQSWNGNLNCNVYIAILNPFPSKIKVWCNAFIAKLWFGGDSVQKIRQDDSGSIGKNIRKLRVASHLTQDEVTAKMQLMGCEISRSIYSQIEGGTYNIRVVELAALKIIFGVDYEAFFEGAEEGLVTR